jgi:uncharacterized protein
MIKMIRWSKAQQWTGMLALMLIALVPSAPAFAQFSESYKFLEAVRKQDGNVVTDFVERPGVTLINTRDRSTGETALHIVVGRRDLTWTSYLLGRGARTDLMDNEGRSPLMLAVERRFVEGVQLLLTRKADPNLANGRGETPLIRAVQMQDLGLVRLLIAGGGDANKRDTLAGMSALDYAKQDGRMTAIVDALSAKPAISEKPKLIQGPKF